MDLTELFWRIDDFYRDYLKTFSDTFLLTQSKSLPRYCRLAPSEVMTIVIHFYQSSYRTFKDYYTKYVCQYLANYFPEFEETKLHRTQVSSTTTCYPIAQTAALGLVIYPALINRWFGLEFSLVASQSSQDNQRTS